MKGVIRLTLAFIFVIFLSFPSFALTDVDVKFVEYVYDLGKYIEKKPVYERGDSVKVYVEVRDVNRFRAYAIDFVFIVYDPEGYPVLGKVISKSGTGWIDEVYAVYEFDIGENWELGKYKVEVYVFDVLNATATYKEYREFRDELIEEGSAKVDVRKLARTDVDYVFRTVYFEVVKDVKSKVYVFDSSLKAKVLPVGMNNSLLVSLFNAGDEEAKFYVKLFIDGEKFSKKKVGLKPWSWERIEFEIPQLSRGKHTIEILVDWDNVVYSKLLPIFLKPVVFEKPILVGKLDGGFIVLSENNYVLGSASTELEGNLKFPEEYSVNKENAAKMLTNILAYTWFSANKSGDIDVGLYIKSDERSEKILPNLLDYISEISKAPIKYRGVVEKDELGGIDVLFYVTDKPELSELEDFVKNGGILIIDVTDYWFGDEKLKEKYALEKVNEIYRSFFDLSINKTVEIKLKTELHLPPELKYFNLTVSDFIVRVGEEVKISVEVKNEGGAGKVPVLVYINDEEVYNETMEFYTNEVKYIEFTYVPEKEGAYKVVAGEVSKVFFAKEEEKNVTKAVETPKPLEKRRENAGLIAALVGVLALLIAVRIYLRR